MYRKRITMTHLRKIHFLHTRSKIKMWFFTIHPIKSQCQKLACSRTEKNKQTRFFLDFHLMQPYSSNKCHKIFKITFFLTFHASLDFNWKYSHIIRRRQNNFFSGNSFLFTKKIYMTTKGVKSVMKAKNKHRSLL